MRAQPQHERLDTLELDLSILGRRAELQPSRVDPHGKLDLPARGEAPQQWRTGSRRRFETPSRAPLQHACDLLRQSVRHSVRVQLVAAVPVDVVRGTPARPGTSREHRCTWGSLLETEVERAEVAMARGAVTQLARSCVHPGEGSSGVGISLALAVGLAIGDPGLLRGDQPATLAVGVQ